MATPSSPAFVRRDAKNSSILKLTACAKAFTDVLDVESGASGWQACEDSQ